MRERFDGLHTARMLQNTKPCHKFCLMSSMILLLLLIVLNLCSPGEPYSVPTQSRLPVANIEAQVPCEYA